MKSGKRKAEEMEEANKEEEAAESHEENSEEEIDEDDVSTEKQITAEKLRASLSEPTSLTVIRQFFLQNNPKYDHVKDYIESGGSVGEMLDELSKIDTKKKPSTIIVFLAVRHVIIKVLTDFPDRKKSLSEECNRLITNYLNDILSMLAPHTHIKYQKITMNLLTALASVNDQIANQIILTFDFPKDLLMHFTEQFDPTEKESLRVYFMQFVMALTIGHDPGVINKLCLKTTWIPSIFPNMKYDLYENVILFMKTMEKNVIMNPGVFRTAKLHAFNSHALEHISSLYYWNPKSLLEDRKVDKKVVIMETDPEELQLVREQIHKVLLILCTSFKHGVAFNDRSYGLSMTHANSLINQFISRMGQPWEDELKGELICKILETIPDLIKPFCNLISSHLHPASPRFFKVVRLLTQAITSIDIKFQLKEKDYLKLVQNIILPPAVLSFMTAEPQYLLSSPEVREFMYKILLSALNKIKDIANSMETSDSFINLTAEYLLIHAPSSEFLLNCLVAECKQDHLNGMDNVLKTLLSMNSTLPQLIDVIRHNKDRIKKVQELEESVLNIETEEDIHLKEPVLLRLLQLEIILNPRGFKKTECVNKINLLSMLLKSADPVVHDLSLETLREFLEKTGSFTEGDLELDLWMYCLDKVSCEDIGDLLAESLKYANKHKYEICNMILRAQGRHEIQLEHDVQLDAFLENSLNHEESISFSKNVGLALSPLLPSILSLNQSKNTSEKTLIAFMIHYAHSLDSTAVFSSIIQNYDCPATKKVLTYLSSWETQPTYLNLKCFKNSIYKSISNYLLDSEKNEELSEIYKEDNFGLNLCLQEILFILKNISKFGQIEDFRIEKGLDLINIIIKHEKFSTNYDEMFFSLLEYFKPTSDFGMNKIIFPIMIILKDKISKEIFALYANKLAHDLQLERKKKTLNISIDLETLFTYLNFSESNIKSLSKIFMIDPLLLKGQKQWIFLFEYILKKGEEYKIIFDDKTLCSLAQTINRLHKKEKLPKLCSSLKNYLEKTKKEICGEFLDELQNLFETLCFSYDHPEELSCFLAQIFEENGLFKLPDALSAEQRAVLLSSLKNGSRFENNFSSKEILKFFSVNHDWISNIHNLIHNIFSQKFCRKVAKGLIENSSDVYPSEKNLNAVKLIFFKCEMFNEVIKLTHDWLFQELHDRKELCQGLAIIYLDLLQNGSYDFTSLPRIPNKMLKFLIHEGMSHPSMINLVTFFVEKDIVENISKDDSMTTNDVFDLVTGHSKFVATLVQNDDLKNKVLKLISTLVEKNDSIPQSSHLPLYFSAYNATLSQNDQLLLKILQKYESSGVSLSSCKPFVWSESAREHYSVKSNSGKKINPLLTLEVLDTTMIEKTITDFPNDRDLNGICDIERDDLYDPAFIIPVLSQIMGGGLKIPIRRMFQNGAVAFALAALSSTKPSMRAASYYFIKTVYENIPKNKGGLIWSNFIDSIRGGISSMESQEENKRLSSIVAVFLAKSSLIITEPTHPMFSSIHNFFYAKSTMNVKSVPAFLELFNSTSLDRETKQMWILEVIRDGLREASDFQLALNQLIFKIILDYHSSSLASRKVKVIIDQIVAKCLTESDKDAHLARDSYSFLPWIHSAGKSKVLLESLPQKMTSNYKHIVSFICSSNKTIEAC